LEPHGHLWWPRAALCSPESTRGGSRFPLRLGAPLPSTALRMATAAAERRRRKRTEIARFSNPSRRSTGDGMWDATRGGGTLAGEPLGEDPIYPPGRNWHAPGGPWWDRDRVLVFHVREGPESEKGAGAFAFGLGRVTGTWAPPPQGGNGKSAAAKPTQALLLPLVSAGAGQESSN
jgi:hypothetical protein